MRLKREPMTIVVEYVPTENYDELMSDALNVLADALADQIIAKARAEVAAKLGITSEQLELRHEKRRLPRDILNERELPSSEQVVRSTRAKHKPTNGQARWYHATATRADVIRQFDITLNAADPEPDGLAKARRVLEATDGGTWVIQAISEAKGPRS